MKQVEMKQKLCVSVHHARFPKEYHIPDWAHRDNQVKKGGQVDCIKIPVYGQQTKQL